MKIDEYFLISYYKTTFQNRPRVALIREHFLLNFVESKFFILLFNTINKRREFNKNRNILKRIKLYIKKNLSYNKIGAKKSKFFYYI